MTDTTMASIGSKRPKAKRTANLPFNPAQGFALTPLAAAVIAATCPAGSARAQDTGDDDNSLGLEEIVVTATRRESNLQDVPQSISAFSTGDIERQSFQNMEDFVKALPSMNLVNSMPGRNALVMRGVSTGSAEYRTDSQVSVYLDEQPMTSISQQVDVRMVDIARIESLPGPQGTLFGSSSQSGTLRIITNKPDNDGFSGQVNGVFGTTKGGENSYDVNGHLNIPLIDDRLAVRLVGFKTRDGGYIDNVPGPDLAGTGLDNADAVEDDWNDYETKGGRVAVLWTISDDWDLLGNYIVQNGEATGAWDSDPALGDFKVTRFYDEYRNDDWHQASLTLTGDLGFAEVQLTASDFSRDIDYQLDNMAYEQWKDAVYGAYYPLYNSDYTFGTIFNFQEQDRKSYEARLTSTNDSRLQWMVGAFYEDVHDHWFYGALNPDLVGTTAWYAAQTYAYYANYYGYDVQYPLPETDVAYRNTYDKTITQKAVFSELTYNLTDAWSVTGGVRWFEYDRKESDIFEFPAGLPVYGSEDTGGKDSRSGVASDTVLKFSSQYHVDDDRMLYFTYSEGFRLGGNNSTRAANTGQIPLSYGPDTLKNYEVGLKSEWLDHRAQLNVSAFLMKWDDIQINDSPENAPFWLIGTVNAGSAETMGIEINGTLQVTERLLLQGSVFLADPEFSTTFTKQDGAVIEKGSPMPNSPEQKAWLAVQYTVPNVEALGGDLWFRYDTSYQSETWNSLTNIINNDRTGLVPSWTSSNVQAGTELPGEWEVSLMVRNVWDERNINWITTFTEYGAAFGDPRFGALRTYQRPRSVSLNIRKRF